MINLKSLNKIACTGAAVLALSTAMSATASDLRLKFAGTLPLDHPGTQMMKQIETDIEAADVGLKVSVFPANQLGSGEELFEDSIRGNIDMVAGFIYSHKDPVLEINSLPYLASSWAEMDSVVRNKDSAYNQIMRESLDKLGIHLMENIPEGFTGIVANKKPGTWEGVGEKGMNIRVWSSNVVKNLVEMMGYNATTMAWGDIFPALQSGIVDGAICCTSQAAYTIFAVSDVGKYFVANDAIIDISSYYISQKTWNKMNDEQRAVVKQAFAKAADQLFAMNKANDEVYRGKLVEKGYEVLVPTDAQKLALKERVQAEIWPQIEPTVGKNVLDRIKADAS
ncbi:TRAP transporter substrate-binding protein DctP [Amphritea sp. HPY]|uniref:TRAP transporter substrate-binding protein DctP n=1 Tax=Amphritea sp. HPY TaxID=3421652 RepID=UPI003D7C7919